MKNHDNKLRKIREHHPQVGVGLFLIILGLALLVATNDILNLGDIKEYFTWETAMVFVGVLLLVNLHFIPGLLLTAAGVWFFIDDLYGEIPVLIKTIYWPSVIIFLGLAFIISSAFKKRNLVN